MSNCEAAAVAAPGCGRDDRGWLAGLGGLQLGRVIGWQWGSGSRAAAPQSLCQQLNAVFSDGPDPDADPVGYALSQIKPLQAIHSSDSSAMHAGVAADLGRPELLQLERIGQGGRHRHQEGRRLVEQGLPRSRLMNRPRPFARLERIRRTAGAARSRPDHPRRPLGGVARWRAARGLGRLDPRPPVPPRRTRRSRSTAASTCRRHSHW